MIIMKLNEKNQLVMDAKSYENFRNIYENLEEPSLFDKEENSNELNEMNRKLHKTNRLVLQNLLANTEIINQQNEDIEKCNE